MSERVERVFCASCGKVAYSTRGAAIEAGRRLVRGGMRAYVGECGHWHLSSHDDTPPHRKGHPSKRRGGHE